MLMPRTLSLILCLSVSTMLYGQAAQTQTGDTNQVTTQSIPWSPLKPGLSIRVIKPGTGDVRAKPNDHVVITYVARVKDAVKPFAGTKPDKGYQFQLGHDSVLPGIQQGVLDMLIGEHRQLLIAPEKGFGNNAIKGVPAGSTLVVDVLLVNVIAPVTSQILNPGTGTRKAKSGDLIAINYIGKLVDGTVFDTNDSVTTPFAFGIETTGVIPGMSTGVMDMVVGEKRRITIPSQFGYGDATRPGIPPNSTLVFDITCLSIDDGYTLKTTKPSKGTAIKQGQTGEFALRIETLSGQVLFNNQFGKFTTLKLTKSLNPAGLYYIAVGMHEGEVREALLKAELGFSHGKTGAGQPLNVVIDLVRIVNNP